jgi:Ran GTPase-activating protein (RanGAP) involved in mRNA processing and transport
VLLDHAMISDEHADALAEYTRDNTCTELLHLGGNELTNEGLTVLAAALPTSSIRRLSLAGNNVQDEGALALGTALAKGFAPEHIDLSDNMLTDTGALGLVEQALKHGPALVWLDLRANPLITSEGRHEARAAAERARFELLL